MPFDLLHINGRRGRLALALLAAGLAIIVLPACSVREDRSSCPCVLVLSMDRTASPGVSVCVRSEGDFLHFAQIPAPMPEEHSVEVPRGKIVVDVVEPEDAASPLGGVIIPEGSPCPALRMYGETLEAEGGYMFRTVELRKNYCLLTVRIASFDGSRPYPFSLEVRGDVCGYLPGGEPARGPFRAALVPADEEGNELEAGAQTGYYSVRIPRQADESLLLDVVFEDDVLRTFALGAFLAEAGFDWTAPDLADAYVDIDYARTSVSIVPDLWRENVWTFETVI